MTAVFATDKQWTAMQSFIVHDFCWLPLKSSPQNWCYSLAKRLFYLQWHSVNCSNFVLLCISQDQGIGNTPRTDVVRVAYPAYFVYVALMFISPAFVRKISFSKEASDNEIFMSPYSNLHVEKTWLLARSQSEFWIKSNLTTMRCRQLHSSFSYWMEIFRKNIRFERWGLLSISAMCKSAHVEFCDETCMNLRLSASY